MNTWLLRHTRVAAPPSLCYGRTDVPLAASFATEAAEVLAHRPHADFFVVSSPSLRCQALAKQFCATPVLDERLRELDFGEWEMRQWADIPREQIDSWSGNFVQGRPPGGESFAELHARATAALDEARQTAKGRPLLLCTHGGVIRALLATARGLPLRDAFPLHVDFGSYHELARN